MTAAADIYNFPAGSGGGYGGMDAPGAGGGSTPIETGVPAWMAGKPLNEWFAIPNTSGAGGAYVDSFSGLALREDISELWSGAAGGHGDTLDNRVVSIKLSDDAPSWVTRRAASAVTTEDTPYYPDGTPASRHTYQSLSWVAARNRYMLHGFYGSYPNAGSWHVVDGFNPDTNQWDAAGTWPNAPADAGWYGFVRAPNGDEWYGNGVRWNQASNDYTSFSWPRNTRFPGCWDTKRNCIFTLQYGDGQGGDVGFGLWASAITSTGVQSLVTLNGSALAELVNIAPVYSGMDYDPILDKYLFYPGAALGSQSLTPGRVYVIDPDTYSVSIMALGAGSVVPAGTPPTGSGVQSKFRYVPQLKGFVLLPRKASDLYFIRTSQ